MKTLCNYFTVDGVQHPVSDGKPVFAVTRDYMVNSEGKSTANYAETNVGCLQFYVDTPDDKEKSRFIPSKK